MLLSVVAVILALGGLATVWFLDSFGDPLPQMLRSDTPLLIDVDGDGDDDLVYISERDPADSQAKLVAVTTPEHEVLWSQDIDETAVFFEIGGAIGRYTNDRAVYIHNTHDGTQRWTYQLPDRIWGLYGDAERLWLNCSDETYHLFDLETGEHSEGPQKPPQGMKMLINWHERINVWREPNLEFEWPGLKFKTAACRSADRRDDGGEQHCVANQGVAYAIKSPGTAVPYIVGFERPSGALKWKFQLYEDTKRTLNEWPVLKLDEKRLSSGCHTRSQRSMGVGTR